MSNYTGVAVLMVICGVIAGAIIYFLPTVIAKNRQMDGIPALFLVNLLLGWTLIGWIVVLLWAALGQTRAQRSFFEQGGRQ
jgi:hypothetical protein